MKAIDLDNLPTDEELEAARLAIEDELVLRRNNRMSVLRNNGACIKEADGSESPIIRMTHEQSMMIGITAILQMRAEKQ